MKLLEVAIEKDSNTGKPVFFNVLNNRRIIKEAFGGYDLVYYYDPNKADTDNEYFILHNICGPTSKEMDWVSLAVLQEYMIFDDEMQVEDYEYATKVLNSATQLAAVMKD